MFRYMISFTYKVPQGAGFMSVEWPCNRHIRSMDDITRITNDLRSNGYIEAVVLSFSLFADPAPANKAAS
ncbi:hypothetical protein [Micromonospora sp. MH99]|uniref:hypothetical protein n=1 Tax=Micromonospora sp. MH99 TaxID=1945510 RepID=UPI001F1F5748|nr:hypothetical protein [Micromonospora sp. MH99]MCF0091949.1 hypothetical protein [Micromonospora sp. MH99]